MNNTEMLRMLIPKERFRRRRVKRGTTFGDAEANFDRRIAQNKEDCALFWHFKVLETFT